MDSLSATTLGKLSAHVKRRYSWQVFAPAMTLEEIADVMGITRERVRQIEVLALKKLRRELRKRGYEDVASLI